MQWRGVTTMRSAFDGRAGQRVLRSGLVRLAIGLGVFSVICPLRLSVIRGESMAPTLQNGSLHVIDRAYYRKNPVRAGDVVVFKHEGVTYTKRVAAAPGDTLWLMRWKGDRTVERVEDWQLGTVQRLAASGRWGRPFHLWSERVAPGECFVLGDNSTNSIDSREFGPIPLEAISGRMMHAPPVESRPKHLAATQPAVAPASTVPPGS